LRPQSLAVGVLQALPPHDSTLSVPCGHRAELPVAIHTDLRYVGLPLHGYADKNSVARVRSDRFPVGARVHQYGGQTSLELGLTQGIGLAAAPRYRSLYATARVGCYTQNRGGHGEALVGRMPVCIREDYSTGNAIYGGLEVGLRQSLDRVLGQLGLVVNGAEPDNTHLTIGVITNYHQAAVGIGLIISR
jgi:hypothetical protein